MSVRTRSDKETAAGSCVAPLTVDALAGAARLGVSERSYHELRKRPDFPRAVDIFGSSRPRWRIRDLDDWVANLPTIDGPFKEPRQLAARRNDPSVISAPAPELENLRWRK